MTCNNYIFRVLSRNSFEEGGSFITDIHVRTCTTLSRLVYHTQAVLLTYLYKDVCTCISAKTDRTYLHLQHLTTKKTLPCHPSCYIIFFVYI